jgi:chitinase
MTYDIHGVWDANIPSLGAFVRAHTNLTEIEDSLDLLWRNNIDPARGELNWA